MNNPKRVFAGVAAAAVVAGIMLTAGTAPAMAATSVHHGVTTAQGGVHPDDLIGPFPDEYSCLNYGSIGYDEGLWSWYECLPNGDGTWTLETFSS